MSAAERFGCIIDEITCARDCIAENLERIEATLRDMRLQQNFAGLTLAHLVRLRAEHERSRDKLEDAEQQVYLEQAIERIRQRA